MKLLAQNQRELKIIHAGSLTASFQALKEIWLRNNPETIITNEAIGSVDVVRRITEQQQIWDIIAVADYEVIPKFMFPNYAEWYIIFARNEMVLLYTKKSRYSELINEESWRKIFGEKEVSLGITDPQKDPMGYRALMTLQLSDMEYSTSLVKLIQEKQKMGTFFVAQNEKTLLDKIESGNLDYAIAYYSLAVIHNLKYQRLPYEVNLGQTANSKDYLKANIDIQGKNMKGAPIMYGLTIPNNAGNRVDAIRFIKLLLDKGKKVLEKNGQIAIFPAYSNNPKAVPETPRKFLILQRLL